MNRKALLAITVLSVLLISGCTRMDEADVFCKTRGYEGAVYAPPLTIGDDYCIRTILNDRYEKQCFDYLNGRYYFIECDD